MSTPLSRLVILDRDGTINVDAPDGIRSADDWQPIAGSLQAIARLNQAGYRVAVATNQSGIAKGWFDLDTLNAMHRKLHDQLDRLGGHVDAIAFCPHQAGDGCDCRKPSPGMLERIAERFGVEPANAVVIGDSLRDIQAARSAGARPLLVRTGKGRTTEQQLGDDIVHIDVYDDLTQAVSALLLED